MKVTEKQQKSAQIAQLFDEFAENLPSRPHLSAKAEEAMSSARPKTGHFGIIAVAAVCCAVILLAVFVLPGIYDGLPDYGNVTVFSRSQLGEKVYLSAAEAEKLLPLSVLKQSRLNVVYERYHAYYFESSGEFAYVCALLGVEAEYGIIEVRLIADSAGYVEAGRKDLYDAYIRNSDGKASVRYGESENGETVINAYYNAGSLNYYVSALSNPNNDAYSEEIVKIFSITRDKNAD